MLVRTKESPFKWDFSFKTVQAVQQETAKSILKLRFFRFNCPSTETFANAHPASPIHRVVFFIIFGLAISNPKKWNYAF